MTAYAAHEYAALGGSVLSRNKEKPRQIEARSRYTAALSHLPDPALRLLQNQVSVTVMLTGVAV